MKIRILLMLSAMVLCVFALTACKETQMTADTLLTQINAVCAQDSVDAPALQEQKENEKFYALNGSIQLILSTDAQTGGLSGVTLRGDLTQRENFDRDAFAYHALNLIDLVDPSSSITDINQIYQKLGIETYTEAQSETLLFHAISYKFEVDDSTAVFSAIRSIE